jgi:hypothetical protein
MRYLRRVLVVSLGVSLMLMTLSTRPAVADPVGNSSQDCKAIEDLGLSHGECVRAQSPSEVCTQIEDSLVLNGQSYPYKMQIYVANADNIAVPATPVTTIDNFGACVGTFAPWQIEWVAIIVTF